MSSNEDSDFSDIDIDDEFGNDHVVNDVTPTTSEVVASDTVVEDKKETDKQQQQQVLEEDGGDSFDELDQFEDFEETNEVVESVTDITNVETNQTKPVNITEDEIMNHVILSDTEGGQNELRAKVVEQIQPIPTTDTPSVGVVVPSQPVVTTDQTKKKKKKKKKKLYKRKNTYEEKENLKPWYYREAKPYDSEKVKEFMKKKQQETAAMIRQREEEDRKKKALIENKLKFLDEFIQQQHKTRGPSIVPKEKRSVRDNQVDPRDIDPEQPPNKIELRKSMKNYGDEIRKKRAKVHSAQMAKKLKEEQERILELRRKRKIKNFNTKKHFSISSEDLERPSSAPSKLTNQENDKFPKSDKFKKINDPLKLVDLSEIKEYSFRDISSHSLDAERRNISHVGLSLDQSKSLSKRVLRFDTVDKYEQVNPYLQASAELDSHVGQENENNELYGYFSREEEKEQDNDTEPNFVYSNTPYKTQSAHDYYDQLYAQMNQELMDLAVSQVRAPVYQSMYASENDNQWDKTIHDPLYHEFLSHPMNADNLDYLSRQAPLLAWDNLHEPPVQEQTVVEKEEIAIERIEMAQLSFDPSPMMFQELRRNSESTIVDVSMSLDSKSLTTGARFSKTITSPRRRKETTPTNNYQFAPDATTMTTVSSIRAAESTRKPDIADTNFSMNSFTSFKNFVDASLELKKSNSNKRLADLERAEADDEFSVESKIFDSVSEPEFRPTKRITLPVELLEKKREEVQTTRKSTKRKRQESSGHEQYIRRVMNDQNDPFNIMAAMLMKKKGMKKREEERKMREQLKSSNSIPEEPKVDIERKMEPDNLWTAEEESSQLSESLTRNKVEAVVDSQNDRNQDHSILEHHDQTTSSGQNAVQPQVSTPQKVKPAELDIPLEEMYSYDRRYDLPKFYSGESQVKLVHSPDTLAKRLHAAIDFLEYTQESRIQLALLEKAKAIN